MTVREGEVLKHIPDGKIYRVIVIKDGSLILEEVNGLGCMMVSQILIEKDFMKVK
jgi:hypothetical protein